jgi:aminoglycoside phosphotransferase (APT) family kinase protein
LGTAFYYGSVVDGPAERYWLFLEKIEGRELYQVGEEEIWGQAARWLARFHSRYRRHDNLPPEVRARLGQYDAKYYECWMERATSYLESQFTEQQTAQMQSWQQLTNWYPKCVRELTALPTTLIHGEFYASNVIVQGTLPQIRVCPVDWERAALGPGLIDLAALVGGNWTELQKRDLALQYFDELRSCDIDVPQWKDFLRVLNLCRLHLAVQWLGWSRFWSPPREHQQDWRAEAFHNAHVLGVPAVSDAD